MSDRFPLLVSKGARSISNAARRFSDLDSRFDSLNLRLADAARLEGLAHDQKSSDAALRRARQPLTAPHHIPALETDVLLSDDEVDRARLDMARETIGRAS